MSRALVASATSTKTTNPGMRTSARFAFANSVADITDDDDDDDASRSTSPSRRDARVVVEPRARRRYPFVIVDAIVVDVELA